MTTTFTTNLGLIEPGINEPATTNAWGALLNTDMALIDSAITGILSLGVGGGSNVVLTTVQGQPDQSRNVTFIFTGVLTGNINVLWPQSLARNFRITNNTTGAFTLSAGANDGTGMPAGAVQVIPQDRNSYALSSDGTNVEPLTTGFIGNLNVSGSATIGDGIGGEFLAINGGAASNRQLLYQTAGSNRWALLADVTAESTPHVGSDLQIARYGNDGSFIDVPLTIARATGIAAWLYTPTFPTVASSDNSTSGATTAFVNAFTLANYLPLSGGELSGSLEITTFGTSTQAFLQLDSSSGVSRTIFYSSASNDRWHLRCNNTAESGSNAGSDFVIGRYTDAGAFIENSVVITRSTGVMALAEIPTFPTAPMGDVSTDGVNTTFVNRTLPTSIGNTTGPAGTGAFVVAAGVTVSPTVTTNYVLTAQFGQSFASGATNWGCRFTIGSTNYNSTLSTVPQISAGLMAVVSIPPGSTTIEFEWFGQNANVNLIFSTLKAEPTN